MTAGHAHRTKLRRLLTAACAIGLGLWLAAAAAASQEAAYDLLIAGGHVIDPANEIDGVRDVGIRGGRIVRVAPRITAPSPRRTVDAASLYVVPGLVDLHTRAIEAGRLAGKPTMLDSTIASWSARETRQKVLEKMQTGDTHTHSSRGVR